MFAPPKTPKTRASSRSKTPATAPAPVRSRKVNPSRLEPVREPTIGDSQGRCTQAATTREDSLSTWIAPALGIRKESARGVQEDREPLKAYLRIRPAPENPTHTPYLTVQSNKTVLTIPPAQSVRLSRPATSYTFTNVFPPETSQAAFFSTVGLPLVQDVMAGENGLLFAYGLSGAGKTWTIQGGKGPGEEGLVWRVLRSIMSSVRGEQGDLSLRMVGKSAFRDETARDSIGSGLDSEENVEAPIKIDRNYTYSVFVSYAEVYNEKVFDLLDPAATSSTHKRKALALKSDPSGGGKYIHGLREVRVRTTAEAHATFSTGLTARQVSGTKVNHHSSRSHAIFSIRVVRVHKGRPNSPNSINSSRLSIVDLAGSERTKATLATGDRLKESGSINKSLMILGQCMEVLRSNQRKLALAGTQTAGPVKLAVVPFRHSKLTELFQDFFIGEGRAVMVVNVNPYDGGYEEIVNVMRFSALASQVKTGSSYPNGLARLASGDISKLVPEDLDTSPAPGDMYSEDDDDEAEPEDPLVTHLFEQLEDMRQRLYEAEMRCAVIESETREEVTREMEGRMRAMERMFSERIMFDAEQNEAKIDSKIDLVNRAMMSALGKSLSERDDSMGEVEEQLGGSERESAIFLDNGLEYESETESSAIPHEGEWRDKEASDESESGEDGSQASEEWAPPSNHESSEGSRASSPVSKRTGHKSMAGRIGKGKMSIPPVEDKTPDLLSGKENVRPNHARTTGKFARASRMIKQEPLEEAITSTLPRSSEDPVTAQAKAIIHQSIHGGEGLKVKLEQTEGQNFVIPDRAARRAAKNAAGEGSQYVPDVGEVEVAKKKKRKLLAKSAVVTEEQMQELSREKDHPCSPSKVKRLIRA